MSPSPSLRLLLRIAAAVLALFTATAPVAAAPVRPAGAVRLGPPVSSPVGGVATAALRSARLVDIFWGDWDDAGPALRPARIDHFVRLLVRSRYFDGLAQYGAGRPRFGGEVSIPTRCGRKAPAVVGPAGVARLVACTVAASGRLARGARRGDLLVDVLLPDSTRADLPGGGRCLGSDGDDSAGLVNYHGNTVRHTAGPPIPFTVVSAGCAAAAGGGTPFGDPYRHLTWALTHEIVEALTDPLPGYGWIDRAIGADGEAADVCEPAGRRVPEPSPPVPFLGGTVTPYWSNRAGTCVAPVAPALRQGSPSAGAVPAPRTGAPDRTVRTVRTAQNRGPLRYNPV